MATRQIVCKGMNDHYFIGLIPSKPFARRKAGYQGVVYSIQDMCGCIHRFSTLTQMARFFARLDAGEPVQLAYDQARGNHWAECWHGLTFRE